MKLKYFISFRPCFGVKEILYFHLFILGLSCRHKHDAPYDRKIICLPYTVSNKIAEKTWTFESFGRVVSGLDAHIVFHVLSDKSEKPKVILKGNSDIIDRVECKIENNSFYNQNELRLQYKKCMIQGKTPSLLVHIYGHELFSIQTLCGSFISEDTLTSNTGTLTIGSGSTQETHFDITTRCSILTASIFGPISYHFKGEVDSLSLDASSYGQNPPNVASDIRGLKYRVLDFAVHENSHWKSKKLFEIRAGKPDSIYYKMNTPQIRIYYQGTPTFISRNSTYNPFVWEP